MEKSEIEKVRNAYVNYNLNYEYEITEKALNYIYQRINSNKEELEKLIKLNNEKITLNELINILDNEIKSERIYKKDGYIKLYDNNFVFSTLTDSSGVVAVECFDTLEVIKYLIKGIKSRNAIVISDIEYAEFSVKLFVLSIIKEALKKFNIDENLLNIVPYEECYYEIFDEVIYTYDKEGKILEKCNVTTKKPTEKLYIFMEDNIFEENVKIEIKRIEQKQKQVELITGKIDDAIYKINQCFSKGAIIFTSNAKLAYKFINLVKAKNVFVNTSLVNMQETENINNPLYLRKNVIFQIPSIDDENKEEEKINKNAQIKEAIEEKVEDEVAMTEVSVGLFEKIKSIFKKIFKT